MAVAEKFIILAGSTEPVDITVAAASPKRSRILSVTEPDEDISAEASATRTLAPEIVEEDAEDVAASPSINISPAAEDDDTMSYFARLANED